LERRNRLRRAACRRIRGDGTLEFGEAEGGDGRVDLPKQHCAAGPLLLALDRAPFDQGDRYDGGRGKRRGCGKKRTAEKQKLRENRVPDTPHAILRKTAQAG
jgi:hypothetical protein